MSEEERELQELDTMVHGVNEFMEKESGMRGALLPNDPDSDLESIASSPSTFSSSSSSDMTPMTFNAEAFLEKLQEKCFVSKESHTSAERLPVTLESFMDAMDKELQTEAVLDDDTFQRKSDGSIDTRANLLKHLIASVEAQQGSSGPASNMIGGLGLKIPRV
jgi:hypothetical protein